MKKTLFFRFSFMRVNMLKRIFLMTFVNLASYPRLLLEVFIRKNFGERYFSFAAVVTLLIILIILPFGVVLSPYHVFSWKDFFLHDATWYIYLAAFLMVSLRHRKDLKRNPSVFDFGKYSLFAGDINQRYYDFPLLGRKPDTRLVETLYEPLPFFVLGIALWLIGQNLGTLLIICSVMYGLSYVGTYHLGDEFVMNKIDEMIFNEELEKAFVFDKGPEDTRGVRTYGRKPVDQEKRQKIVDFATEDDAVEAK